MNTNKAPHTPPPWNYSIPVRGTGYLEADFRDADGKLIFVVALYSHETAKAHCALLKAAPELLVALEKLLEWVAPIAGDNQDFEAAKEEIESVEHAKAAISKAKGEA